MDATLQQVFRESYERYRERHNVSLDQHQAALAIMQCQDEVLGYEEWRCEQDGHIDQQAHSCRHRSCPRCQQAYTQHWLEQTQARLLPCDHSHVVFTLPLVGGGLGGAGSAHQPAQSGIHFSTAAN